MADENKQVDVFKALINNAAKDAGKLDVILKLQVQILAHLQGRDPAEIWAKVDEDLEAGRNHFFEVNTIAK